MKDRYQKLKNRKEMNSIKTKKKLNKEGPIITLSEISPREMIPTKNKTLQAVSITDREIRTERVAGKPFKRNFRIDPNQIIIIALFDPDFGMKLARSYDFLSSNDVKKIKKILNANYVSSNNQPLLKLEKEEQMADDVKKDCCDDKKDCCNDSKDQSNCTNDADTCKKGDDCCKKQ